MSDSNEKTILAILAGAAIGAGLGILFAPDKGTNTRTKFKEGFDSTKDDLLGKFNEATSSVTDKAQYYKENFDTLYEDLLSKTSYQTEEVITFLENKLAKLKEKNAQFKKENS